MRLSKPQVAELLRRYNLFLADEPVPPAEGKLKPTCAVLVRLKVLTAGLSLTKLGAVTAQAYGGKEIPGGAEEWLEAQQVAASKRDRKVRDMMKALGESDLTGDAAYTEMEQAAASLKG